MALMLGRNTPLTVKYVENHEPVRIGHVYIAPPDHHLLVEDGLLALGSGPVKTVTGLPWTRRFVRRRRRIGIAPSALCFPATSTMERAD